MGMNVPFGHKQAAVLNILISDAGYLLLRRRKEPNRGLFTPVGGKIDAFETPEQAARRETLEETGIVIGETTLAGILVDTAPTSNNWVCFVYTSRIAFQEPPPCPEGELEWIAVDKIDTLPIPVSDRYIYELIGKGTPFVLSAVYNDKNVVQEIKEELTGVSVYGTDAEVS